MRGLLSSAKSDEQHITLLYLKLKFSNASKGLVTEVFSYGSGLLPLKFSVVVTF